MIAVRVVAPARVALAHRVVPTAVVPVLVPTVVLAAMRARPKPGPPKSGRTASLLPSACARSSRRALAPLKE